MNVNEELQIKLNYVKRYLIYEFFKNYDKDEILSTGEHITDINGYKVYEFDKGTIIEMSLNRLSNRASFASMVFYNIAERVRKEDDNWYVKIHGNEEFIPLDVQGSIYQIFDKDSKIVDNDKFFNSVDEIKTHISQNT